MPARRAAAATDADKAIVVGPKKHGLAPIAAQWQHSWRA